jgi:hypothetical protein
MFIELQMASSYAEVMAARRDCCESVACLADFICRPLPQRILPRLDRLSEQIDASDELTVCFCREKYSVTIVITTTRRLASSWFQLKGGFLGFCGIEMAAGGERLV